MDRITSRKNENVRVMRELIKSADYRRETDMFAVEGDHLCGELAGRRAAEFFLYTEKAARKYPETVEKAAASARLSAVITGELAEYISDTKSPQGLFAAAERFDIPIPENARRLLVMDGVQDPGNVGTMLRAAEAFGTDGAVLFGSCADRFSPKTLRASMGSVFRMAACSTCDIGSLRKLLDGFTVYGAMLDSSSKRLGEVKFPEKTAVVIGSEGAGISPGIAAVCGETIYIPIKGAESLNAAMAASVLLWELSK